MSNELRCYSRLESTGIYGTYCTLYAETDGKCGAVFENICTKLSIPNGAWARCMRAIIAFPNFSFPWAVPRPAASSATPTVRGQTLKKVRQKSCATPSDMLYVSFALL